jgi:hypothetical protein
LYFWQNQAKFVNQIKIPVTKVKRMFWADRRPPIPNIARSAHRTDDAVISHEPLELLASVLAAAIGVMQ